MAATKEIVPQAQLVSARKAGLDLLTPIKGQVEQIQIKSDHDYMVADQLLQRIIQGDKAWLDRVDPIISPIYQSLQLLYDLKNDIHKPFEEAKEIIKGKMKTFKLEEQRKLRAAEEERQREILRLEKEAREKEEALAKARTNPMKEKLAQKRAELEQERSNLLNTVTQAPIRTAGSSTRTVRKWRIISPTLLLCHILGVSPKAIMESNVMGPDSLMALIMVDPVQMNAKFKLDKPEPGVWMPGVECWDDIDISGRRL